MVEGYDGKFLDDAYVLSLDGTPTWFRIDAQPHPGPTDFHSVVYDAARDRLMLFGGNDGQPLDQLWSLKLTAQR